MKGHYFIIIILLLISTHLLKCSKPMEPEIRKPVLLITLKDDSGKLIRGANVRLYKNISDSGISKLSDSTGVVIFYELEAVQYHWLASKGCSTNRVSQTTLNRPLVPNGILYGYSVLSPTGTLKIINNSTDLYKVSDSLSNISITIHKDTPYIGHRKVRSYIIRSEKTNTPGTTRDTLLRIRCGDTTVLNLPY